MLEDLWSGLKLFGSDRVVFVVGVYEVFEFKDRSV
jgi:hypothetical protein